MAQVDLTGIEFFLPILSFLIVFIICYFLILSSKLIDNKYVTSALSFMIATIFVSASGPRNYILAIVPWFAVLIIGLFLIMVLTGFVGKDGFPTKTLGKVFLVILAIIFVVTAIFVFSNYFSPYLPGSNPDGANPDVLRFVNWIYAPRVAGALLLLGVSLVVAWFLVNYTK